MNNYNGAMYIGVDPIHLMNGDLILQNEITYLLSEEAAINDNLFKPVYDNIKKKPELKSKNKKSKNKGGE